ncbi:single stranded DNA-binding protein [Clavibacter phage CN1A]|uniref:Single stranded DNA-binding protein n=1 Tax=Clavibacter phage CN1A TaxID=1406793 RepID=U5PT65_9CAUD|nr:single stranded DNA-binding protein [Clavibacter phage CN1A]AGY47130.1 single stranded DNA-binding protein [Clavibacter phage CN1A]
MGQVRATFDGAIVAGPEIRGEGKSRRMQFPVYVNDRDKNRDTGEYEDSGVTTKIQVTLWGDKIEELGTNLGLRKNVIVEVDAVLVEREFTKRDQTQGRQMETKFVNDITVKWAPDGEPEEEAGF